VTVQIDRKLEDWKRRLLDLTRRNPALYFHPEKPFNLKVEAPEPERLLTRLLGEEKKRHVFIPPPALAEGEDDESGGLPGDEEGDFEFDLRAGPEDLVIRANDGKILRRRLKSLYRAAHADFEERALHTLYLAFGLLHWTEGGSEQCTTPLLMVPVTLARDPEKDTYTVGPADDEPVVNPSLAAKLAEVFHLALPDIPDEWDNGQYEAWIESVRNVTRPYKWDVEDSRWLARFSFHKLSLYQDLSAHADAIKAHDIVRALAGGDYIDEAGSGDSPDERDLDAKVSPHESFSVLDADSSQLACIEAVNRGRNVIVQGPPGTGKSQTIVNLIAQLIATNKTVLFVSEKIAALEVVYARLKGVGLGGLCHELHSHKANKREVVNELHRSLTQSTTSSRVGSGSDLDRLSSRRAILNEYANAIGKTYGRMGAPLFRYLGDLAHLHDIPHIAYRGDTTNLDDVSLNSALDGARALQRVWVVVAGGASHPWYGLQVDGGFLSFKSEIEAELSVLHAASTELRREVQRISAAIDLSEPTTFEPILSLHRLATIIDIAPRIQAEWLSVDGPALQDDILEWKRSFDERSDLAVWLREAHVESAISSVGFDSSSWSTECERLKVLFGSEDAVNQLLATLPESIAWLNALSNAAIALASTSRTLCAELGSDLETSIVAAESLIRAAEMAASGVHPEVGWFTHGQYTKLCDGLTPLRDDAISVAIMRREILEGYDQAVFDFDIDQLIERFAGEFRSLLRFFNAEYRHTMAALRAVRKDGKLPKTLVADLRHIRDYLRREKDVADAHSVTIALLGDRYKKAATDFGNIGRCLELVSDLRGLVEEPSPRLVQIMAGLESAARAKSAAVEARLDVNHLSALFAESNAVYMDRRLINLRDDVNSAPLRSLIPAIEQIVRAATSCEAYLVSVFDEVPGNASVSYVASVAAHVEGYRELEKVSGRIRARILSDFGDDYIDLGEPTWVALERVAEWLTHKDLVLQHGNDTILRRLRDDEGSVPLASRLEPLKEALAKQIDRVAERFVDSDSASLRRLRSGDTDEVRSVCEILTQSLDRLHEWRDYKVLESQLSSSRFAQLFLSMIASPALDPAKLVEVAKKSILQAYVDAELHANTVLREFRGDAHFELIREFRRLDKMAVADNARRVIELSLNRRPRNW